MISNVPFHSFKSAKIIDLRTRIPFRTGVLLLIMGAAIVYLLSRSRDIMVVLFIAMCAYLLSGYYFKVLSLVRRRRPSESCDNEKNQR